MMSMSYFRRQAAQCYRDARSSSTPQMEYESLMRLGQKFKVRATAARARVARMRHAALLQEEAERRDLYRDSRE
jgi:DNA-binding transcriptional regulator PaaX